MSHTELEALPSGLRFLAYPPSLMPPLIERMANEAIPMLAEGNKVAIIGILRRGAPLADKLMGALERRFKLHEIVRLDLKIKRYADDLTLLHPTTQFIETPEQGEINLKDYTVLVVDDVLYSGYSLFRAIEWLKSKSPRAIYCAVLAHRHAEVLPLKVDIVGVHLQIAPSDIVECHVPPYEEQFKIEFLRLENAI